MVSHALGRLARFSLTHNWFEEPLNEIVPILINDVTVISDDVLKNTKKMVLDKGIGLFRLTVDY